MKKAEVAARKKCFVFFYKIEMLCEAFFSSTDQRLTGLIPMKILVVMTSKLKNT